MTWLAMSYHIMESYVTTCCKYVMIIMASLPCMNYELNYEFISALFRALYSLIASYVHAFNCVI